MIEWLKEIDEALFLFLNGIHSPIFDEIMWFVSGTFNWIPLYLLAIVLMFRQYKWQGLWVLLAIAILITITDQFTSSFMKPFFGRLRPCHDPAISDIVHVVKRCGGQYSFVSGHSANTFAVATFFFYLFRNTYPGFKWGFIWAGLVAYSRVYLGVHYPGDIIIGGLIGFVLGLIIFKILEKYPPIKKLNSSN